MADLGKKISELQETTDLAGLYTIGTDKNTQSKKVSLQFLKEAADFANAQGDYAKEVGDTVAGNVGVNAYPTFSASTQYAAGSVVNYNGKLYRFTSLHPAGAWVGTDAVLTSIKAEADLKLTELESEVGVWRNLDISTWKQGYYQYNGYSASNANWRASNSISLTEGQAIYVKTQGSNIEIICEEALNSAGGTKYPGVVVATPSDDVTYAEYEYIAPKDMKVVVNVRVGNGGQPICRVQDYGTLGSRVIALENAVPFGYIAQASRGVLPNIDSKTGDMTIEGSITIGGKTYEHTKQTFNLKNGIVTSLLKIIFNTETMLYYPLKYDAALASSEIVVGVVRLEYSSLPDWSSLISVNFPFAFTIDNAFPFVNDSHVPVVCPFLNNTNNIILDEANKKVILHRNGFRILYKGVVYSFNKDGGESDIELPYGTINGGYVLNPAIFELEKTDFTYEELSEYISSRTVQEEAFAERIVLFCDYYGNLIPSGLFSDAILAQMLSKASIITAIIPFVNNTNNIILDEANKKVILHRNGFRILYEGVVYSFNRNGGESDIELPYGISANGGYVLNPAIFELGKTDFTYEELSKYISFYDYSTTGFTKGIVLYCSYYGNLIPSGLFSETIFAQMLSNKQDSEDKNASVVYDAIKNFSKLFNNVDAMESFVFFTDPHLGTDAQIESGKFAEYIKLVQKYQDNTSVNFVMCGGDWLTNNDTQEGACRILAYIDGATSSAFNKYIPIIGNHDYNYQGILEEGAGSNTGELSISTLRNLWYRSEGRAYFAYETSETMFFVLDTGTDWYDEMTDYRKEQTRWLAEGLKNCTKKHIIFAFHIYSNVSMAEGPSGWNNYVMTFPRLIRQMGIAYNNRTVFTMDAETFDFSDAKSKVEFCLVGHSHFDHIDTTESLPIVCTTNMQSGGVPTFDLVFVDYDKSILHLVRVGTGESRTLNLCSLIE